MINKIRTSMLSLLLMATFFSNANPIDVNVAKRVAESFYQSATNGVRADAQLMRTGQLPNGTAASWYAFNTGSGFVIVAADDRITPVLGFSDESNFVNAPLPDNVKYLLDSYSAEIEYIINNRTTADETIAQRWSMLMRGDRYPLGEVIVAPLITSKWAQTQYYNDMCPADDAGNGGHALTGCGACVMGQVMRYWRFPENGIGSHSYTCNYASYGYGNYGVLSANFGNTTYDYDNMPNKLSATSTSEQVEAVATLLYHCGVAVEMAYGPNASTCNSNKMVAALSNFFGYPTTIEYLEKSYYSSTAWTNIIKRELDSLAPLFYGGSGDYGGHVFICDGYRDDDYFHINWGWNGSYNGNYLLSDLTPGPYGFNSSQAAIIGIRGPELPIGIAEHSDIRMTIYPNPAQNTLFVEGNNIPSRTLRISIYDISGKLLLQTQKQLESPDFQESIDIRTLPDGLYLTKIQSGDLDVVKKIVISE